MTRNDSKFLPFVASTLFAAGLLGGCATVDQEARDMAQDAMIKANSAQSCCDDMRDGVDRMYQKMMSK